MTQLDHKTVKRLLGKEDPLIVEIGACYGTDTAKFLQEFKNVKIYCFEPDPRCVKIFMQSIKDDRCVLIEAAISDVDGSIALNLSHRSRRFFFFRFGPFKMDQLGQSSIVESVSRSKDFPWLIFSGKTKIRSIKLDTWLRENGIRAIDIVWSDMQGAERKMIDGASSALRVTRYLYVEYGETSPYPDAMTRNETIALLSARNFRLVQEYSDQGSHGSMLFKNMSM